MGIPFVPIRKVGKLPGETLRHKDLLIKIKYIGVNTGTVMGFLKKPQYRKEYTLYIYHSIYILVATIQTIKPQYSHNIN